MSKTNVSHLATLLGKDSTSPLVRKTARVAAAYTLGKQAYTVGKQWHAKRQERLSSANNYTVIVESNDTLYPDLYAWVVANTDLSEQHSAVARSLVQYREDVNTNCWTETSIDLVYDGNYSQSTEIEGHRIQVAVVRPGATPKDKKNDKLASSDDKDDDVVAAVAFAHTYGKKVRDRIVFTATSSEGRDVVLTFLADVLAEKHHTTQKFQPSLMIASRYGNWSYHSDTHIRPLDSVILRAGQREDVLNDIERFLGSEEDYVRRAIPWHRGYLFHGPPGGGKTSLAMGLANHLHLNLSYVPLGDMDKDANLLELIGSIQNRSILLFEDVDVFVGATARKKESGSTSLSGLLNALDGVATPHGLITIMTTNNIDALDEALVRPGRVDRQEEIGYVDEDQATRFFSHFYPEATSETAGSVGRACVGMAPARILEVCKRNLEDCEVAANELIKLQNDERFV